ncbi:HAD hydrolase-like protein [Actinokineospora cianjurensis]|uniref:Phosphoglycolate phosphatase-like HAD superfamily hydrolase n=1 Tax=Actinokineospora cianjurensis TaxID=585224 RepID=A0A421B613_9PSEU|nr:haloacid dehalogenase-like hydrolase [Actinokineospora cianjurensis]RLK59926.1 phosphoglycolate phosphatase-like HAD superfamily hydrolase [Actinokineospora cianjurensis]
MAKVDPTDVRPRLLVLWDIDHTLIETRGVGFRFFQRAFQSATGRPLARRAKIAGRTELDIIRESLRVNDIEPTDDAVSNVAVALTREYEAGRVELGQVGQALPGAHDALHSLTTNALVFQTVLTGNLPEVARVKLEVFGLANYLNLDAGAFGADHTERAALVGVAQERASARTGVSFSSDATVLIGDTPGDVAAGRAAGARVIGIATGKTTVKELQQQGATQAVESLQGVDMGALLGL